MTTTQPRQTPPALAGQVVPSVTVLCRSCSTSRTMMAQQGKAAIDRQEAQRAWQKLGWVLDLLLGWTCPQCAGTRPSLITQRPHEKAEEAMAGPMSTPAGGTIAALNRKPSPLKGRTRAVPTERRTEIIYCPQCRKQLTAEEYTLSHEDIVMTTSGGIAATIIECRTHGQVIARKTEFVIITRSKNEAADL